MTLDAPASPRVTLIAAVASNGVIGRDNTMPWHLPEDLKRFKALTLGNPCIMGRKTWESILATLGRPLPGRTNIVLTRNAEFRAEGATVARSIGTAVASAKQSGEIFVIGGEKVYAAALPLATRLMLTEIHREIPGDARFPDFDRETFAETSRHSGPPHDGLTYDFVVYERRVKPMSDSPDSA